MKWIREHIYSAPSFLPFTDHLDLIENYVATNPTLCVETCKALLEGICKTILTNKSLEFATDIKFQVLVQKTITAILNSEEPYRDDLTELGRRIASVSQQLGSIRNNVGFVSHGMDVLNPRLTETVSRFTYRITDTIGGFILNCYLNNRVFAGDSRIHYDDCKPFNDSFDDENPFTIGTIQISASKALYTEDYEAYKESYFEYLEDLKNRPVESEE